MTKKDLTSNKYQHILKIINGNNSKSTNGVFKMDELLTLEELSKYLKISKPTLYKMVEKSKIPALKIANQWRFKKDDINIWIEKQRNFDIKE